MRAISASRRRRSKRARIPAVGIQEVLLGGIVHRGDAQERVAGLASASALIAGGMKAIATSGRCAARALEPAPEAAVLADPEQPVEREGQPLAARVQRLAPAGRAAGAPADGSRASAQVGVHHAEAQRVERAACRGTRG